MKFENISPSTNYVFRVDSSYTIGSGHLYRCLNIAKLLLKNKVKVLFIVNNAKGNFNKVLKSRDISYKTLPESKYFNQNKDLQNTIKILNQNYDYKINLIVDHYNISSEWEIGIRTYTNKLIVIDDLANRNHNADFLVDFNYSKKGPLKYFGLVNDNCKVLVGPSNCIFHSDFYKYRSKMTINKTQRQTILIFFGGSDKQNQTGRILSIIIKLNLFKNILVILGSQNKRKAKLKKLYSASECIFYEDLKSIAKVTSKCHFSIGSSGTTIWEKSFLGVPSIIISTAKNQIKSSNELSALGCVNYLGHYNSIDDEKVVKSIKDLTINFEKVFSMKKKCIELFKEKNNFIKVLKV